MNYFCVLRVIDEQTEQKVVRVKVYDRICLEKAWKQWSTFSFFLSPAVRAHIFEEKKPNSRGKKVRGRRDVCNRQQQTFFLCVAAFSFSFSSATPALHTTVITSCLESNIIHQYYADISKKLMTSLKFAKIKVFSSEAVNFDNQQNVFLISNARPGTNPFQVIGPRQCRVTYTKANYKSCHYCHLEHTGSCYLT